RAVLDVADDAHDFRRVGLGHRDPSTDRQSGAEVPADELLIDDDDGGGAGAGRRNELPPPQGWDVERREGAGPDAEIVPPPMNPRSASDRRGGVIAAAAPHRERYAIGDRGRPDAGERPISGDRLVESVGTNIG